MPALKFRLFGIPVKVQAWFLIVAFFLWRMSPGAETGTHLAVWCAVMFLGVLLHEYGHAFTGRAFGLTPNIELYGMGGVTWWSGGRELTPVRSIVVSAAGPAVGIVIGVVALFVTASVDPARGSIEEYALQSVVWVNLGWGIFNLFPILPLDGGNIMASFFELFSRDKGRLAARYVTFAVLALLIGLAVLWSAWIMAAFFAYFGWTNWRSMQAEAAAAKDGPLRPLLEEAQDAIEAGDLAVAEQRGQRLAAEAQTDAMRAAAQQILSWARLLRGDAAGAQAALDAMPPSRPADPSLAGAIRLANGDPEGALRHLELAMSRGANAFVVEHLCIALLLTDRAEEVRALFESGAASRLPEGAVARIHAVAREVGSPLAP